MGDENRQVFTNCVINSFLDKESNTTPVVISGLPASSNNIMITREANTFGHDHNETPR